MGEAGKVESKEKWDLHQSRIREHRSREREDKQDLHGDYQGRLIE